MTTRPCFGNRRDVLRLGAWGMAASAWPTESHAEGPAASARSVIVLWMAGGVTHIDSFDPNPEAPEDVRGTLGTIDTTLPGVRFTEVMPALALQAHRLCLLRSYSDDYNDHFQSEAY